MEGAGLRAQWEARPWTLRLYVVSWVAATIYSTVVDDDSRTWWGLIFTAIFLGFLKKLWDGERALWWLFVILGGAAVAVSLAVAREEPLALLGAALCIVQLSLLVLEPTQAFVRERSSRGSVAGP
jgi:predicted branched-subunit amino acid permease